MLLIQTFRTNKLSTSVITLVCFKLLFASFASWNIVVRWFYFIFAWLTSFMAFYVALVEMTNQVYHDEIFKTYKWSESDSPEEVFGAAGRPLTLYSKAAKLRTARYAKVQRVRTAMVGDNDAATSTDGNKRLDKED